jgi:hypothetical protein
VVISNLYVGGWTHPSSLWCPQAPGHTGLARLWLVSSLVTSKRGLEGPCTVPIAQALRVPERVETPRWGGGLHSTHLPIINSSVFGRHSTVLCWGWASTSARAHLRPLCRPPRRNITLLALATPIQRIAWTTSRGTQQAHSVPPHAPHLRTWPSNRVVVDKVADIVVVARHVVGE